VRASILAGIVVHQVAEEAERSRLGNLAGPRLGPHHVGAALRVELGYEPTPSPGRSATPPRRAARAGRARRPR
jgi:hypothetical protein